MPRNPSQAPPPMPSRRPYALIEPERQFVVHAMRVAADDFKAAAARTREGITEHTRAGPGRVADDLDRSAASAKTWADRFENAVEISVTDPA